MKKYKWLLRILLFLGIALLLLSYPSCRLDREASGVRRDAGSLAAEIRQFILMMCLVGGLGLVHNSLMVLRRIAKPETIKFSWRRTEAKVGCVANAISAALFLVPVVYGACFYTRLYSALDNGGMLNPLPKPMYETLRQMWFWCIGLLLVSAILWLVFGSRRLRKYRALEGQICPECRYPLTGLPPGSRCPECGQDLADTVAGTCPENVNTNTSQER